MTVFDVVMKLVGQVNPIGDSTVDEKRLENMKNLVEVFEQIHTVIDEVAYKNKDAIEHSRRLIGEVANDALERMGVEE